MRANSKSLRGGMLLAQSLGTDWSKLILIESFKSLSVGISRHMMEAEYGGRVYVLCCTLSQNLEIYVEGIILLANTNTVSIRLSSLTTFSIFCFVLGKLLPESEVDVLDHFPQINDLS